MATTKKANAPVVGEKVVAKKATSRRTSRPAGEKKIPEEVNILNSAGGIVRTYTRKEHGDNLVEMAEEYARKTGKRVQVAE